MFLNSKQVCAGITFRVYRLHICIHVPPTTIAVFSGNIKHFTAGPGSIWNFIRAKHIIVIILVPFISIYTNMTNLFFFLLLCQWNVFLLRSTQWMNACVSENIAAHLYFKGSLLPQAFAQLTKLVPLWRWIRQEVFLWDLERETHWYPHTNPRAWPRCDIQTIDSL